MDYVVTISPHNWQIVLKSEPRSFAFRRNELRKLEQLTTDDRLVIYLAQEMCWCGVFEVAKPAYRTDAPIFNDVSLRYVVEVRDLVLPQPEHYISVKDSSLASKLERFSDVDFEKSGWIYKARLARSLSMLNRTDTDLIIHALVSQKKNG